MDLQAKRTILVAQREQLMANVNATSGAIALCEELIGEEAALLKAAEHAAYMDKMAPPLEPPFTVPFFAAPETLPVSYDEDEAPAVERALPIGASA